MMLIESVEEVLRKAAEQGIEYRLVPVVSPSGYVDFYMHPMDINGETLDFTVDKNHIHRLYDIAAGSARSYQR